MKRLVMLRAAPAVPGPRRRRPRATISGAAQLIGALRRKGMGREGMGREGMGREGMGSQWPLLVAGGLSTLVGFVYIANSVGDSPRLLEIVTYAAAGGAFFVIQSGLLAWRLRKAKAATA